MAKSGKDGMSFSSKLVRQKAAAHATQGHKPLFGNAAPKPKANAKAPQQTPPKGVAGAPQPRQGSTRTGGAKMGGAC